jgi:hypothetical protein
MGLMPLFKDAHEDVRPEQSAPGTELDPDGSLEVCVLEGGFSEGGETNGPQTGRRLRCTGPSATVAIGVAGVRLVPLFKGGHEDVPPGASGPPTAYEGGSTIWLQLPAEGRIDHAPSGTRSQRSGPGRSHPP